jgi:hypothetical protein
VCPQKFCDFAYGTSAPAVPRASSPELRHIAIQASSAKIVSAFILHHRKAGDERIVQSLWNDSAAPPARERNLTVL